MTQAGATDWLKFDSQFRKAHTHRRTYIFVAEIHKKVVRQADMKQVKESTDNTITAQIHSTNNTNYNKNKCQA